MSRLKSYLAKLFFPTQFCVFCGKTYQSSNRHTSKKANLLLGRILQLPNVCAICKAQLQIPFSPYCSYCHKPLKLGNHTICAECQKEYAEKNFLFNRSALLYNTYTKDLIALYKYRGKESLATELSYLLKITYDYYFKDIEIDFLTYVPLHENRLQERSFNQSKNLADGLNALTGVKIIDSLVKLKDTTKMSKTYKSGRQEQAKDAYLLRDEAIEKLKNKNILIIDDIYTTGTTINECAKTLKAAGAKEIYSLTLARAFNE